jgi:small subunit ribosomal protein S1
MFDPNTPESKAATQTITENQESFKDILSQFEQSRLPKAASDDAARQIEATVIVITADSVLLDIGRKSEGILPLTAFQANEMAKPGDKLLVTVKGRNPEGYYELSRFKIAQPTDWTALEKAFAEKSAIAATVTAVVKGGLSVDVGVRAFMPASRSGARDAAEMEKLVGQEIRCRIIKLDSADEDVVVDRRVVAEEEERGVKERRYAEIKEGDTLIGTVRSLAEYGAFVDIGGADALLHVSDVAWSRIARPEDVLSPGQQVEVKVLKIDSGKQRISVGMKQLLAHPWDVVAEKYKVGERVRGSVTRLMDFGAFVELEPGIEGLIHISEMAWTKKVRKPGDVVKTGDTVEAVILGVNQTERRISLGLKQALGDPWADAAQKVPVGSVVEGPVTNVMKFGAFVQIAEGVEGMVHISELSAEKRIEHPTEVVKNGQTVKALILAVDQEKRQLRLSIKQLAPTDLDEFLTSHTEGDVVTGRVIEVSGERAQVELGEGVRAICKIAAPPSAPEPAAKPGKTDLSSLSAMLNARWKGGASGAAGEAKPASMSTGQVLGFRITRLDRDAKKIELELA